MYVLFYRENIKYHKTGITGITLMKKKESRIKIFYRFLILSLSLFLYLYIYIYISTSY